MILIFVVIYNFLKSCRVLDLRVLFLYDLIITFISIQTTIRGAMLQKKLIGVESGIIEIAYWETNIAIDFYDEDPDISTHLLFLSANVTS